MRRALRLPLLGMGGLPGLFACAAAQSVSAPAARPEAYHGVVVWMEPVADTVTVAFHPEWRRLAAGADSVWAFARARTGGEWAHGRMEGDSLVWGLDGMAGDAGLSAEFAGVPEPDGTVRGCLRAPRRGWAPSARSPRAAFVLRPVDRPAPSPSDAPLDRCR